MEELAEDKLWGLTSWICTFQGYNDPINYGKISTGLNRGEKRGSATRVKIRKKEKIPLEGTLVGHILYNILKYTAKIIDKLSQHRCIFDLLEMPVDIWKLINGRFDLV